MALKINRDKVSNKAWGEVDKSKIWGRLKEALQSGEEGAKQAVKEMYAVVKAEINKDLAQADCWGPHHEIIGDELVLNKNGVIAAVQALAGARAEPNLSDAQWEEARKHLARHYRELELELPPVLGGEMFISAEIKGEMLVEDIPVAPWVNLEELKRDDPNPLEVVVAVPAGKNKRGWRYTEKALQKIVDTVNSQGLPGTLGHQKPDDVNHEFPMPVTHWIGAKFENGVAYFRGVIDKAASDLKRWIRSNVVRNVSIFGIPTLKQVNGEMVVEDFQPLSIDWTPVGRNGMDTKIVAIGEIDSWGKEAYELTREEVLERARELGITVGEMLGVLGGDAYKEKLRIVGEIEALYGLQGEELIKAIREDKEVVQKMKAEEREKTIEKIIGEMVQVEQIRPLVKKLIPGNAEREEDIRKAVGEIVASEEIKQILDSLLRDNSPKSFKNEEKIINTYKVRI